ncbi:MAG TPA: nucleotide disphospho-sugar-binding domain-containing protein, partial [Bryobacteraceae bacterium]|nr:nucleotide disphospho-sugar-binding domain-containing protein [Bryobacteraceae bacterium]
VGEIRGEIHRLYSITPEQFADALAHGRPLHDEKTIRTYVKDELRLLERTRPDIVVGDLRHSLSISARVARIPCVALVNAYWSPYSSERLPVPTVALTRLLGVRVANLMFRALQPVIFAAHCAPVNAVRREYGHTGMLRDIRRMYTDADWVVYPDVPELVPANGLPETHAYIGPILWSPAVAEPQWWRELPHDRPVVYVTLGSSGSLATLAGILGALADEPVTLAVAGVNYRGIAPRNAFVADYLSGSDAVRRASLVISNGGSPTSYQALAQGRPVLGIPQNMDQHVAIGFIARAGAGEQIRSEHVRPQKLRECMRRLLHNPEYRSQAVRLQHAFAEYNAARRFEAVLQAAARTIDEGTTTNPITPEY